MRGHKTFITDRYRWWRGPWCPEDLCLLSVLWRQVLGLVSSAPTPDPEGSTLEVTDSLVRNPSPFYVKKLTFWPRLGATVFRVTNYLSLDKNGPGRYETGVYDEDLSRIPGVDSEGTGDRTQGDLSTNPSSGTNFSPWDSLHRGPDCAAVPVRERRKEKEWEKTKGLLVGGRRVKILLRWSLGPSSIQGWRDPLFMY